MSNFGLVSSYDIYLMYPVAEGYNNGPYTEPVKYSFDKVMHEAIITTSGECKITFTDCAIHTDFSKELRNGALVDKVIRTVRLRGFEGSEPFGGVEQCTYNRMKVQCIERADSSGSLNTTIKLIK